jgi:hypothetical protein
MFAQYVPARSADMTTPRGCLRVLTAAFMRLARNGNVDGLRKYVHSDPFLLAFNGLDPNRRQTVMRSYAKAEALCEAKARHPLAQPKTIDAQRAHKADWNDPVMRIKLADAYARAGGDDEQAARLLGVSRGSARLAKRRHLGPGTTSSHRQKAVASRRDGNLC